MLPHILNGLNEMCFKNGCYILVVSEPRFRRFYKMILKLFVNDFENFFMTCIAFVYKG